MIFHIINAYLKSINYILTKNLFQYILYTIILSAIVGFILFYGIFQYSDNIFHWLENLLSFNISNNILDTSLSIFTGIILTIIAIFIFKYIVLIIASPLLSPLSEKVESIETGSQVSIPLNINEFTKTMQRSLTIAGRLIVRELVISIPLLILSFIPVIGILGIILLFIVQSYYAGIAAIDIYQERNRNVKETIAFARAHRFSMIGLGSGFVGLLLIPILGVILAPILSTIAGTILGLKMDKKV